jgi:PAS domain S-box-containing protein
LKNSLFTNVLIGFFAGCLFPLMASIIQMGHLGLPFEIASFGKLHAQEPLLWIIDSAPFFLAFTAWVAGRRSQTLRIAAEKELQDHHLKVLGTLEALPMAVFAVNNQGVPYFANSHARALLGEHLVAPAGMPAKPIALQAYLADNQDPYPAHQLPLGIALGGETASKDDLELVRDGRRIKVEMTAVPIIDKMGKVLSAVAVVQDITERRRSERQILQSRAFLDSLVQNLPIMLFVKEAENLSFVRLNKFGEELIGVSEADMLGKSDFDFFPHEQAIHFVERDREVLRAGGAASIIEEPITTMAKGKRMLRTHKVAVHDAQGKPNYLLGISEDITELKQAEELNQKYMDDLQRAYRNLDQFAYVISHDLKAPMRGIRNLTDWIVEDLQGKVPESVESHIKMLQDRTEKLERLINGVLEYSRSGRRKGAAEQVDTALLVPEVAELAGIREPFRIVVPAQMPVISTDKLLLAQVMTNLILNAVQHHDNPEGKVLVTGNVLNDEWVEFMVSDDGPGIPAEMQERIFQLFYTQDGKGQGSGIGLAIVKKIVEDQGGVIKIKSALGKGTEFRFTWPVQMRD